MIKKIPLPYSFDALEPYYSKETLVLHYDKLYQGYVDNTNKTEEKLNLARQNHDFENIKCLEKNLSFFGSGAILHQLFFENLAPKNDSKPDENLMQRIRQDFGSYETFQKQFNEAAKAVEASRMVPFSICS
jgi:superoxide dismutase